MKRYCDLTEKQQEAAKRVFYGTTLTLIASGVVVPDELLETREHGLALGIQGLTQMKEYLTETAKGTIQAIADHKAQTNLYVEDHETAVRLKTVDEEAATR